MFDSIVQAIADYPYLGVALFFLICGLGFPLPEELVLIAGGYICAKFPDKAQLGLMMLWCGGSILAFDLLPFVLGRIFGARIMRLRWLRITFTRKRLATFDRWFRRRGDLVIFLARFLAGIRVIAFFTVLLDWPDREQPWLFFVGFPIIGGIGRSGVYWLDDFCTL